MKPLLLMSALVLALIVGANSALSQTLYRCKQGGQTVFSERPCGKSAEKVDLPGYVAAPPATPIDEVKKDAPKAAPKAEEKTAAKPVDNRPPALSEDERADLLAKRCVDKYRPHLAYPNGVRINGRRLKRDGFGETIFVDVRTITNPDTPAGYDPITLNETFICRSDGKEGIDDRYTEDYVERHKRGIRTDTQ